MASYAVLAIMVKKNLPSDIHSNTFSIGQISELHCNCEGANYASSLAPLSILRLGFTLTKLSIFS